MEKITPCLRFDAQAEEAAQLHVSVFKNSRILEVVPYGEAGPGPKGAVMDHFWSRSAMAARRAPADG